MKKKTYFLFEGVNFFLTLDTIDILWVVYSDICPNEIIFVMHKRIFADLGYYFIWQEI